MHLNRRSALGGQLEDPACHLRVVCGDDQREVRARVRHAQGHQALVDGADREPGNTAAAASKLAALSAVPKADLKFLNAHCAQVATVAAAALGQ
jgi:hypothetical protein